MNFIGFVLALPLAFAQEQPTSTIDLGLSGVSRTNLDAFSGIRLSPSVLPLISRYQAQGSIVGQIDEDFAWNLGAAIMDSSTGPIAMGLQVQYSTGAAPLEGEALPGWRMPNEDLVRDIADLGVTAAAAVSFLNRQYSLGMSTSYFGRTYVTRVEGGNTILDLIQNGRTDETRVHQVEINASASAKLADMVVLAAGFNDWLAISEVRKPFLSARFGVVDTPRQSMYENMGGIELDIEGAWGEQFGLGTVGLGGDVRLSEVMLRSGYRYDFVQETHHPALGIGLDDGEVSLDYGVQFDVSSKTSLKQWHSIGVRFRL